MTPKINYIYIYIYINAEVGYLAKGKAINIFFMNSNLFLLGDMFQEIQGCKNIKTGSTDRVLLCVCL